MKLGHFLLRCSSQAKQGTRARGRDSSLGMDRRHHRAREVYIHRSSGLSKRPHVTGVFTGRTDAETEAPILWSPDVKSRLIGKDPDAGAEVPILWSPDVKSRLFGKDLDAGED